jgi:hypothetical protein
VAMKSGSVSFALVLMVSALLCSQWDRLFESGSLVGSFLMFLLIAFDFACILHYFKNQQSAQVLLSTQLVSIISSVGMVLFCLIQGIVG